MILDGAQVRSGEGLILGGYSTHWRSPGHGYGGWSWFKLEYNLCSVRCRFFDHSKRRLCEQ